MKLRLKHVRSVCVFAQIGLLAGCAAQDCGGRGYVTTESAVAISAPRADGGEMVTTKRISSMTCNTGS